MLQAYALQKTIESLGTDCEIIEYKSSYLENTYKIKKISELRSVKEFLKWLLSLRHSIISNKSFEGFARDFLRVSERKYSKENIVESNERYDLFIVGSDQVWNFKLNGEDSTYFLDFVKDNKNKNSYAASFGYAEIPQKYLRKTKELLSEFNQISVREQKGRESILALLGRTSDLVLDPTLLLDGRDWNKLASEKKVRREYILVYTVAAAPSVFAFAKNLAKENNCDIIYIRNSYRYKTGMKNVSGLSPCDFTGYIKNARYVVTTSFHGICFSVNFEKDFFYELDRNPKNNNSRIETLTELLKLGDREIVNGKCSALNKRINYTSVNKILSEEKKKSIDFLTKLLGTKKVKL